MYHDFFEIITEEKLQVKIQNKDDFFKGAISNYGAYSENLDFKRDLYINNEYKNLINQPTLRNAVISELKTIDASEEAKVYIVTGPPGVGKSVLLRRLAYDIASEGITPVVIFDKTKAFFDLKLLSSLLVDFDRKFDAPSESCSTHRLKPLIIIDDPAVDVVQVKDYLSSRRRLGLIVTALRINELEEKRYNVQKKDIFILREKLSPDEKTRIIRHLFEKGILTSPDENWDLLLDKEFKDSFFATLYMLVYHTRKPLNEIIQDQYSSLDSQSRKAFSYISGFHQFDSPINIELLVRALGCGYSEFVDNVLPKTRGLIFDESTKDTLLYTTHHRIIAKKTIEFFFKSTKQQKELFLELFSNINFKIRKEKELIEKLMVTHLCSYSKSTDLTKAEKIEIFEKVTSQCQTKVLLHHLGILYSDYGKDVVKAEGTLRLALALQERGGRIPQKTEIDQNIETSLGVLHQRLAVRNLRTKSESSLVNQEVKIAESLFLKSRFGAFPNAHAYHAHSKMFIELGDAEKEELKKQKYYSSALDIISDAKDNLNEDQFELVAQLEVETYQKIGKIQLSMEKAVEIAQKYKSARGYTLIATTLIDKAENFNAWMDREPLFKRALMAVDIALKEFPQDERSLIIKAKLTRQLSTGSNSEYLETLKNWYINAKSPNILLLFELGMASFKEKEYIYSKNIFEKLENERLSGGIKNRYTEELYLGPKGKPIKFIGVISSIENRYDGYIRVDSLPELCYPLHFRPIICPFQAEVDDMVEFNIAFDFIGARAVRVSRLS